MLWREDIFDLGNITKLNVFLLKLVISLAQRNLNFLILYLIYFRNGYNWRAVLPQQPQLLEATRL